MGLLPANTADIAGESIGDKKHDVPGIDDDAGRKPERMGFGVPGKNGHGLIVFETFNVPGFTGVGVEDNTIDTGILVKRGDNVP